MITLTGKKVSEGIAIGRLTFYKREGKEIRRIYVKDVEKEVQRFQKARMKAIQELKNLYDVAAKEVGDANAAIFEMQQTILEEQSLVDRVNSIIVEQKLNAEYALQTVASEYLSNDNPDQKIYTQGHDVDVKDVANRMLRILSRTWKDKMLMDEPFVMAAGELYPSEAIQLDKNKVLGFVTRYGTINSHTAVLARTKGIPSVIGLGEALKKDYDGKMIVVDGYEGKVYIEPDYTTLTKMKQKQDTNVTHVKNLERLKGKENITQSGQKIDICANIGTREDIENVIEKQAECLDLGEEANPSMGLRGIRISLEKEEVFKTQLRAILRASVYGNVSIMFPMITAIEEVTRAKLLLETAKRELKAEKTAFDEEIQVGVMIETPAAVMISGELAREVDFFSIGTNDLTQFTLGMDRENDKLGKFYNAHHSALIKMIRIVTNNVHLEGKKISICGDLAADLDLTETFIQMGIDELSVAPNQVLALRKKIREIQ